MVETSKKEEVNKEVPKEAPQFIIRKSTFIVKNNKKLEDVYDLDDKKSLGKGTYGEVKTVVHKQSKQVRAVKIIPRTKIKNWERFLTEVKILQTLDHPHVIKLYEYFEDETNVYLVTEMCRGGELFDRIVQQEYFSEKQAALVFKQILMALNYCHSMNIVHRDLKPENFLFVSEKDEMDLKIIDFGLSKMLVKGKLQRMKTRAGTPYYISPEVLTGNYDVSCDMWSAGCILYILLCGYPPFYGDDNNEILQNVQKGKYDFDDEEWDQVSKEAKDLISKLITSPERRLTAQEALQHRWIKYWTKKDATSGVVKKLNISNMKKFQKTNKMKQVALMAIAVQTDPADITELKNIFEELDVNGDGNINFDELQKGLAGRDNAENLLAVLKGADVDNSGTINYTEFLAATMNTTTFLKESYLKTAFDMFDQDGSGKIDKGELHQLIGGDEFKDLYSEEQLCQAIAEIDGDGDGEIDFDEFMEMMRGIDS